MPRSNATVRHRSEDHSLEALQHAHSELEARLTQLDRHRSLSPEEQFEVQILKKRKLALKDRMRAMELNERK